MKIVLISLLDWENISELKEKFKSVLLLRTVHRINRMIKPDVTFIIGNIINGENDSESLGKHQKARKSLNLLKSETIIISEKRDTISNGSSEIVSTPSDFINVGNLKFVVSSDMKEVRINAKDSKNTPQNIFANRYGCDGKVISIHHIPIFPAKTFWPGYSYVPHKIHDNVISLVMIGCDKQKGSIAFIADGKINSLTTSSLWESPFRFYEINIDGDRINTKTHNLAMPEKLKLQDIHLHTKFAYCNENMDIYDSLMLAREFGLSDIFFSEHSSHLYFNNNEYYSNQWFDKGMKATRNESNRIACYLKECPFHLRGMELDIDSNGNPVIASNDYRKFLFFIGAVHRMKSVEEKKDIKTISDEFLWLNEKILSCGIKALAHPFRVFRRGGLEPPECLFPKLVSLLKEYNVAAEINYHTNEPEIEFFKGCIHAGVKIALGSDSHNLYEVGEFVPHLAFLKECGVDTNVQDILLKFD